MPRGNLEGIQPRILLLKEAISLIKATRYGKAFRLLRQHKLDINLIYDVDPQLFLDNIAKFVRAVPRVDYLNLFVNSLSDAPRGKELDFMYPEQEEEVLKRKHEEFMAKIKKEDTGKDGEVVFHKVNKICDALRAQLEQVNIENRYLLPILTTFVKKQPQEL
jgi:elongator complex protein 1